MTSKADILLVDDDPDLQESLRIILETHGYEVRTASNSKQAQAMIDQRMPDLMVLDVMMDTMTEGFDFAHDLKSRPQYAALPIILLTCFLEKVRDEGPDQFQHVMGQSWPAKWLFEKPVKTQKLLEKIEAVLREYKAERA
jgi:DNA-binding response OmpR family regulator